MNKNGDRRMQAIILAAGIGKRLQPLTNDIPKCMVSIKGKPIIYYIMRQLAKCRQVKEVIIVCGYKAEAIQNYLGKEFEGMKITYIFNDKYATTNNVYSLYLAKENITSDCLLLESDLYYGGGVIDKVICGKDDCTILVSPYNSETMDGTVVFAKGCYAKSLVVKAHQDEELNLDSAYKTVNIYKFSKNFICDKFMPAVEFYVKMGNLNSYYELVLGSLIYYRNDRIAIQVIPENCWYEIDDINDLKRAEQGSVQG